MSLRSQAIAVRAASAGDMPRSEASVGRAVRGTFPAVAGCAAGAPAGRWKKLNSVISEEVSQGIWVPLVES